MNHLRNSSKILDSKLIEKITSSVDDGKENYRDDISDDDPGEIHEEELTEKKFGPTIAKKSEDENNKVSTYKSINPLLSNFIQENKS